MTTPRPTRTPRRRYRLHARSARQRGVVIIIAVFSTLLLAGMLAYVFNTGRHAQLRQETQNAADATAVGGAGYIARSFNTVAMNNVEISRLIAAVQLLDAMPLAVEYTLVDQEAQLDSIERTLSSGISDRAWLRPELENERARLIAKIQLLEEMDQFLNHSGYDMRRMTHYDGPNGRGELWKAMESLDELSFATMEHIDELSQINAIQAGRDNMHHRGEATAAFIAPFRPAYEWRRYQLDDFYNPVIRGILPDWVDDEVTNRGPYDAVFGWRDRETEEEGGGRTPPTATVDTPRDERPRFAGGGSPRFDDGSRRIPGIETLTGYDPYGPWSWLSRQLRGRLEQEFEAQGLDDVTFNDTSLFIRAFGMAMVKMRYLWPQAGYDELRQGISSPGGIDHPISNQFLDPEWITRYAEADSWVESRQDIAYARWLFLEYEHVKINGRFETRYPVLLENRGRWIYDEMNPRRGQRRWVVEPGGLNEVDDEDQPLIRRVGQYVWRDAPDQPLEWTDQQGNRYERYSFRYYVWLGLNVGERITISNPNPTFRSDDLPAPIDFDHAAMFRPADGAIGRPGEAFAILGVAKQTSAAPMWPRLFNPEAYDGHVAIAQAGLFNNHSWDLWTQMWHAQLEPVQEFSRWVDLMQQDIDQAAGFPGLSPTEAEGVADYLRSVEDLAPILLNH